MADHRETCRRALEAYNTGDLAGLEDAFTADHVLHDPHNAFASEMHGVDILRGQIDLYRGGFADLVMTVDAQYEDDDVVVNRWTATGTHTGDLMVPATGRRATVSGILIDRFEGDRIAETWSNWDALGLLQQLGAIPSPEAA